MTGNWKYLAAMMCLLITMAACGQKGDLYLPENQASISVSS